MADGRRTSNPMPMKTLDWAAEPPERTRVARCSTAAVRCWIGVCLVALAVVGGQVVVSGLSEGYCWVWPGIGTRFAAGYSERGFDAIRPGMTPAEVRAILGEPLRSGRGWGSPPGHAAWRPGDEVWHYSGEGSSPGAWAWLAREVSFRDGAVVQTVRWTYRD